VGVLSIAGIRPTRNELWLSVRGIRGTADAGPLDLDALARGEVRLRLQPPPTVTGKVVRKSGNRARGLTHTAGCDPRRAATLAAGNRASSPGRCAQAGA
jgi:hypothetical protein